MPLLIFVDHLGNYGTILAINSLEITVLCSSTDSTYISYLAAFASTGGRDNSVSVRVVPSQTTADLTRKLPLLLLLLLAHQKNDNLSDVEFTLPSATPRARALVDAASKPSQCIAHTKIRVAKYKLHCICARPFCSKLSVDEDNRALKLPTVIKCEQCGWKFRDCEIGITPAARTPKKWECTNCTTFWRVPTWGGDKITNTCPLDSFLAILISQNRHDPRLFQ